MVCLSIPSFVLLSLYFVLFFSSFTSVFVPPIPYPLYFLYLSIVLNNQFQLSTKCPSFPKITDCPTVSFHLIPFLPFISLDHQMSHRSFHLIIKYPIVHFTWSTNVPSFISLDHKMSYHSFHLIIKCLIVHFTWSSNALSFISLDHQMSHRSFHLIIKCPIIHFTWSSNVPSFISLDHKMSHRSFHLIIKCPIIHFTWS